MKKMYVILAMLAGLLSCNSSNTNSNTNNTGEKEDVSKVYFTHEISPEALIRMYEILGRPATGKVAVKLSMGEPGGHNYLKPELVKDLVVMVNGTFIDANTAYEGRRSSTEAHLKTAEEHGFMSIAPVDILDAKGEISLPIKNGKHLTEDIVGAHYAQYDYTLVLSHFKGHAMAGFGGAIKNISIGIASSSGKCLIHTAGASRTNAFQETKQEDFLEAMAEAAKAIADHCGENIIYINVMNNLSVDCDCDANPADPEMGDIGILASLDPVALDQACVDLIYKSEEHGKIHLVERMESKKGVHTLVHAEKIGLGNRKYELIMLDKD